jgi:hypothetical protein
VNTGWVCELVPWEAPEAPSALYCLKAAKASIVPAIYKIQFLARLFALHKLRTSLSYSWNENISKTFK